MLKKSVKIYAHLLEIVQESKAFLCFGVNIECMFLACCFKVTFLPFMLSADKDRRVHGSF